MTSDRLAGLFAAPYTPFDAKFRLRLNVLPDYASHLVRRKVSGVFIGGTTGEWASMTHGERCALAEGWRAAAGANLKLLVHVGHNCLAESRELARHAESVRADGIAALMPSYYRPASVDAAVQFCRQIAAAAPKTPFYFYHMPEMTRVELNMFEFIPKAIEIIPTFRGVKFTHNNLMDFGLTFQAMGDRCDILFGRDEYLLAALAFGATAAVGSTYNYCASRYHKLIEAFGAGRIEEARAHQVHVQRAVLSMCRYGGLVAGKAIMRLIGIDCGPPRPPLEPLTGRALAAMKADLKAQGFFEEADRFTPAEPALL